MFELRSDIKKKPIKLEKYEHAIALRHFVEREYNIQVYINTEVNSNNYESQDNFDSQVYYEYFNKLSRADPLVIILGHDLAQLEQKEDYSLLFSSIFTENTALVEQYKNGNEKALNSLLGKFLKEHKGYDPKEVKEELVKILKQE